jgi:nicotinamidase-related amidase
MTLLSATTALLVIDMQRDFLHPEGYAGRAGLDISRLRAAIAPVAQLLAAARSCGMHVIHTREGHVADLSDCPPYKLQRSRQAGAEIGANGPLGRLLVRGEHGHDFIDELRPRAEEIVIDKPGYSAFHNTDLQSSLTERAISQLIITGITTEVCVSSTLRSAIDRGYTCYTVSDACASAYRDLHEAALRMIAVEGGVFGTVVESTQVLDAISRVDSAMTKP